MIEFKRNSEGVLEAWKNGKKIGEIITMGDLIDGSERVVQTDT